MARLEAREDFTDDLGNAWVFETEFHDGYVEVFVTSPAYDIERRRLRRVPLTVHRPQRDADEALPLDLT